MWKHVDGTFLAVLFAGILLSLGSLAKGIKYLLVHHPLWLWSFFFGLIVASVFVVYKEVKQWSVGAVCYLLLGIAIAYTITIASPTETPQTYWFVFVAGAIAISAMILPGVSGSFLLVLMGQYAFILGTLSSFISQLKALNMSGVLADGMVLAVFSLGCLVGLLSFARVVSWVLKKYWNLTIALLTGFMIGSLNKVWPWKEVVETYFDRHGIEKPLMEKSILPQAYGGLGRDPQLGACLMLMALGAMGVLVLSRLAHKKELASK